MLLTTKKLWSYSKDYIMIIFGLFLFSLGLTAFILPEKIIMGGMAGIGALIYFVAKVPVAVTVYGLNIILLLIAFKSVGRPL